MAAIMASEDEDLKIACGVSKTVPVGSERSHSTSRVLSICGLSGFEAVGSCPAAGGSYHHQKGRWLQDHEPILGKSSKRDWNALTAGLFL